MKIVIEIDEFSVHLYAIGDHGSKAKELIVDCDENPVTTLGHNLDLIEGELLDMVEEVD